MASQISTSSHLIHKFEIRHERSRRNNLPNPPPFILKHPITPHSPLIHQLPRRLRPRRRRPHLIPLPSSYYIPSFTTLSIFVLISKTEGMRKRQPGWQQPHLAQHRRLVPGDVLVVESVAANVDDAGHWDADGEVCGRDVWGAGVVCMDCQFWNVRSMR